MRVAVGDVNALMSHAIRNRHRAETHVDQQGDVGKPKLVEAENGDYGIIATKYMLQCYGKKLP